VVEVDLDLAEPGAAEAGQGVEVLRLVLLRRGGRPAASRKAPKSLG